METRWRTKKIRLLLLAGFFLLSSVLLYFYFTDSGEEESASAGSPGEINISVTKEGKDAKKSIAARVKRNSIYDRNLTQLAVSLMVSSVYVKPLELKQVEKTITSLASVLSLDREALSNSLKTEKGFVWLARNIEKELVEKINNMGLDGVYLVNEEVRFYPNASSAAHVIGFSDGSQGLAGIESYYDNLLAGKAKPSDTNIKFSGVNYLKSYDEDGASVVLTLDGEIQRDLEKSLASLVKRNGAKSGMAMILEPSSGEVLAMANYPFYNVNYFWKYDSFVRRNRILTEPVKAGGLLKMLRMIAEVERGNLPEHLISETEIAPLVIKPRNLKRIISDRVRKPISIHWKKVENGVYWSAPDKEFNFSLSSSELDVFTENYGFTGESRIDLPAYGKTDIAGEKNASFDLLNMQSTATSFKLLTGFSRLLSNGTFETPHLLKDVWAEKKGIRHKARFPGADRVASKEFGYNLSRLVTAYSTPAMRNGVFFESLVEEVDDSKEQDMQFSSKSLSEGMVENGSDISRIEDKRYQNVILAASSSVSPELTMLVVLDSTKVDFGQTSKTMSVVGALLSKSLKLKRTKKRTPKKRLSTSELHRRWSQLNTNSKQQQIAKKNQARKMPSVKNLSLRKALQVLQDYNLNIRVIGSGRVVAQQPKPGSLLQDNGECVLQMKKDD